VVYGEANHESCKANPSSFTASTAELVAASNIILGVSLQVSLHLVMLILADSLWDKYINILVVLAQYNVSLIRANVPW
jgi:hypothetical protein